MLALGLSAGLVAFGFQGPLDRGRRDTRPTNEGKPEDEREDVTDREGNDQEGWPPLDHDPRDDGSFEPGESDDRLERALADEQEGKAKNVRLASTKSVETKAIR